MSDLLDVALAYTDAGCAIVPITSDGQKRPAVTWKQYLNAAPSRDEVQSWFSGDTYEGLGIVCGAGSGHLEMIELEGRAVTDGSLVRLATLMADNGFEDLWRRISNGHAEMTPGGGLHWLYRVDGEAWPNLKLARRPATDEELAANPGDKVKVLIETRGQGGFTVLAPSGGRTHPTGKQWVRYLGDETTIPTITADEREALHGIASMLDEMPVAADPAPRTARPATQPGAGLRPGDDYNQRADWTDILTPHGWTEGKRLGTTRTWVRPGKHYDDGISATTGRNDGDNLYVFSTSTEFDTNVAYSKFAAYTLLNHGGDYAASAKALRSDGYGTPPTLQAKPADQLAGIIAPTLTDGSSALAPVIQISDRPAPTATIVSDAGMTDTGNADLLVARHGHELRYVPERRAWLHWGGTHWSWDDAGRVIERAKATILAIPTEDEALRRHRTKSLSRSSIEAAVALARTHPDVVVPAALLDSDPYSLCTPGGIVNLTSGTVAPAKPSDLHTRSTTVPVADMPTPRWDAFLHETFDGDERLLDFVQRLAGYSCSGVVTHHVLPFLHGSGGNGKSVFLDVMRRILGDYAATAPAGFLLAGQQQHETEVARLAGLRMVICSEVNQEARFDEAKVKLLTGGDALTARFMRADHFTFVPTHHLWLMGNHQPRIGSGGESFARRLRLIGFTKTVPDDKKIDGLDRLLVDEEGPGILAWLVEGARRVLSSGLTAPASVLAATSTYMAEEDALARFVEDRCLLGGGAHVRVNTADARRVYTQWCTDEGERPVSPQVFGREMRTRYGVEQARSHGQRFYVGLSLIVDDEQQNHWADR